MSQHDTIAAVATAPGQGGIGVIRISGEQVPDIARQLLAELPEPRYAHFCSFKTTDQRIIDQGLALYFPKPNSFTGEHVLELQGHGGPVVLDQLLKRVLELGARPARAGEFSERAFLNNKIDLAQAEAIADLIAAESEQSATAAMNSLQGEFSSRINELVEAVTRLRIHIEAALDFPEEEIDFLADDAITRQLEHIKQQLTSILQNCKQGRMLREGLRVVITGKPNAGKSSLLNQLAGNEAAIVSDVPGTTRDVLREYIDIQGVPLHVVDTAGLRASTDSIEQEGVKRARAEMQQADIVIHLVDATDDSNDRIHPNENNILVTNKIDLLTDEQKSVIEQRGDICISAKHGTGIETLRMKLLQTAGYDDAVQQEGVFTARHRHIDALRQAQEHVQLGEQALRQSQAGELMAEEMRLAQRALSGITGEFSSDDLLGRIFSDFCIGK